MNTESQPGLPTKLITRIRNEFAIEIGIVIVGFLLAFSLTLKVSLAVALTCLKFGFADFVTAYLVFRHDPDRAHGVAVALMFIATGLGRASGFAFCALLIGGSILIPLLANVAPANVLVAGLTTGFVCAFVFLAMAFPLSLLTLLISKFSGLKLTFATGLTKLRRAKNEKQRGEVSLDVQNSIFCLGMLSGVSLAVDLVGTLFFVPPNLDLGPAGLLIFIGAFVLPFVWCGYFVSSVRP